MLKTIRIGSKDYIMKSSAFTPFKYRSDYGTDLLKDINKLNRINMQIAKLPQDEQEQAWLDEIGNIVEMALHMAYCMITEHDKAFMPYDQWLQDIDSLFDNTNWIMEVMELAMSTFHGRVQENKSEQQ
jgi:hypothetical protein